MNAFFHSLEAFETIAPLKKIQLLLSLGQLSLVDYYTIPKKKRQTILKEGLVALVTLFKAARIVLWQ